MLHYFPTPYPDELWYSVLCRYHIRTGNQTSAATFRELFEGKDHAPIGSFLPNGTIYAIAKQLPEGNLDIDDIALNHTLFKSVYRFQSLEIKQMIFEMTIRGDNNFPIITAKQYESMELKSCPLCMREDVETYGEAYWHLKHQMTDIEKLQQKHREQAAEKRQKLKERKQRAHRLIERGAILEAAINEVCPAEHLTNKQVQDIIYFAILAPSNHDIHIRVGTLIPLCFLIKRAHLLPTRYAKSVCVRWKPCRELRPKTRPTVPQGT